jgi:hypothetical protein
VSSDSRWSGGLANREWNRAGGRENLPRLPAQVEHQMYLDKLDTSFYCDGCSQTHPLRENCDGTLRAVAIAAMPGAVG